MPVGDVLLVPPHTSSTVGAAVVTEDLRDVSSRALLTRFFTPERWSHVYPILTGGEDAAGISLRLLEKLGDADFHEACRREHVPLIWLVTEPLGGTKRLFNLAVELPAQQSLRRKKRMQAFARRNLALKDGGCFEFGYGSQTTRTNVAQLEFFKFLLNNCVIDWLRAYRDGVSRARASLNRSA